MGRRLVTTCAALGVLMAAVVVPLQDAAGAARPTGLVGSLASAECQREKAEVGKKVFRKRHGPRRAMTRCMWAAVPAARNAIAVATSACQEELAEFGPEEFYADWGTFEECVSLYADWEMDGGLVDDTEGEEE